MTATVHKDITDQFWIQKVKNGEVSNFNFCYRKIKICIFSQGARWIFLILPILETPELLVSHSIGILNCHQKLDMFLVLTSVSNFNTLTYKAKKQRKLVPFLS